MALRPLNVLFLSTSNSARSIFAESILRREGRDKLTAFSAGTTPNGLVHPITDHVLSRFGYPRIGFHSKSVDKFLHDDAPVMDFVFVLTDSTREAAPPVWPKGPVAGIWNIEDPKAATGTRIEQERAFFQTFRFLSNRISIFTSLPHTALRAKAALSRSGGLSWPETVAAARQALHTPAQPNRRVNRR